MPPRRAPSTSFLLDLFAQLFSARARIDAGRCCAYNGFLGLLLLGGALALRLSGPPDPLGGGGFALVVASSVILLAALVVPVTRPGLIPALLAAEGLVIVTLTVGFALACARWALATPATGSFRYLPGLIVVGATYGAAYASNVEMQVKFAGGDLSALCKGVSCSLSLKEMADVVPAPVALAN